MRLKDLTGKVFGRLTVVGISHKDAHGTYYWNCECACGNRKAVARTSLMSGRSKSCGCLSAELARARETSHGMSKTKTYAVWAEMCRRATNPEHPNAKYYVEKGVTVCHEWLKFENFYEDMGEQPEGLWLERIDNSGPYSKENCKWETPSRQTSNRGRAGNTSGRLGVYWDSSKGAWRAEITVDKNASI